MKKIIIVLMCVVLMSSMIGIIVRYGDYTAPAPTIGKPNTSSNSQSSQPTNGPIVLSTPMVSISLPILVEEDTADDGVTVFRRIYQDVVLSLPNADIIQTVTLDLLRRMDTNASVMSDIQENAFADYTGQENWTPYSYQILYSPARVDDVVLSLHGIEDIYSKVDAGISGISVNYNLSTGYALSLVDILVEESTATEQLKQALLNALSAMKDEWQLFDGYEEVVSSRFDADLYKDNTWYFSTEGLCFFFEPYDLAPSSVGIVTATVPYHELTGIISDIYFPAEQASAPGEVNAQKFRIDALDNFVNFSELITDPNSDSRYILSTKGILYDLCIEQGQLSPNGKYTADTVVYAANHLSPIDVLILRSSLPAARGLLRLSYFCGENSYSFYLTADENAELILTPIQ